jgi:multiple sugar transport system permease protein
MAQTLPGVAAEATTTTVDAPAVPPPTGRSWWRTIALIIGALAFLFPFYYRVVGSLQKRPDTSLRGALPMPGNLSLHNYREINAAVSLAQTLLNSVIFTAGAILGTVVFGVLAGYALAQLHYRGRGTLFAAMLLLQVMPFQLFIIPL